MSITQISGISRPGGVTRDGGITFDHGISAQSASGSIYTAPLFFTNNIWNYTTEFSILLSGTILSTTYNPDNDKPVISASNRGYVARVTGNNATAVADDPTKPWKTGAAAFAAGMRWIKFKTSEGRYGNTTGMSASFNPATCIVEPSDNGTLFLNQEYEGLVFSQEGVTNVYSASGVNAVDIDSTGVTMVVDMTYTKDGINNAPDKVRYLPNGIDKVPQPYSYTPHAQGNVDVNSGVLPAGAAGTFNVNSFGGTPTLITITNGVTTRQNLLDALNAIPNILAEIVFIRSLSSFGTLAISTTDGGNLILATVTGTPLTYFGLSDGVFNIVDSVNASTHSYGVTGGKVYVRTWNNRAPDSDICVLSDNPVTAMSTVNTTLWFKNTVMWGLKPWAHFPTAVNTNRTVLTDCQFGFTRVSFSQGSDATYSDALSHGNTKNMRLTRCAAYEAQSGDGIAVFASADTGLSPPIRNYILTQNCQAYANGTGEDTNDNGITVHNGATVLIDIMGDYQYNYGPNFVHIGQVLSLGTIAKNSLGAGTANVDFSIAGTTPYTCYQFAQYCTTGGSTNAVTKSANGQFIDMGNNSFPNGYASGTFVIDGTDPYQLAIATATPITQIGWWDFLSVNGGTTNSYLTSGGNVSGFNDLSPIKTNLSATTRAVFNATNALANGHAAANFGTSLNSINYLASRSNTVKRFTFVGAYKDGLDSTFDDFITFMCNATATQAVRGDSGLSTLQDDGTNTVCHQVSLNGATATATMLPTGFAIFEFVLDSAQTGTFRFWGDSSNANRGWGGVVVLGLLDSDDITAGQRTARLNAIKGRFGIA